MLVGVLALQGAYREHKKILEKCGCDVVEVRKKIHLEKLDGLILPGGESTTIGKLLDDWDLLRLIKEKGLNGMPILGTCAGMIIMAKDITASEQKRLPLQPADLF